MPDLRVLTLNLWNSRGDAAARMSAVNSELVRLAPDLVAFQEVLPDQLPGLLDGTGLHGSHQADTAAAVPPYADRFGGTAIATRHPHRVVEVVDLRGADAPDVPWLTLAAHVPVPEVGDVLFIAPTTSFRPDAEAMRERQVLAISDLDSRHRTSLPTVIAGDFNAAPDAASIRFLTGRQSLAGRSAHYLDAWEVAGAGDGHTWTVDNPNALDDIEMLIRQPGHRRRIDYVFIGGPMAHPHSHAKVRNAALACDEPVDGVWASDHFGVVVDLEIGRDR
jgi:endonuclease/exonuclease/phosphatase family metal-dependent hydrolase